MKRNWLLIIGYFCIFAIGFGAGIMWEARPNKAVTTEYNPSYLQFEKTVNINGSDLNIYKQIKTGIYQEIMNVNIANVAACEKITLFTLPSQVDIYDYSDSSEIIKILKKYERAYSQSYLTHFVFKQGDKHLVAYARLRSGGALLWGVLSLEDDCHWSDPRHSHHFLLPAD